MKFENYFELNRILKKHVWKKQTSKFITTIELIFYLI